MVTAAEWSGSHESKLLRMAIGYLHFFAVRKIAVERHGTPLESLSEEQRKPISMQVVQEVFEIATQLTPEFLDLPPGGMPPSGKAH